MFFRWINLNRKNSLDCLKKWRFEDGVWDLPRKILCWKGQNLTGTKFASSRVERGKHVEQTFASWQVLNKLQPRYQLLCWLLKLKKIVFWREASLRALATELSSKRRLILWLKARSVASRQKHKKIKNSFLTRSFASRFSSRLKPKAGSVAKSVKRSFASKT